MKYARPPSLRLRVTLLVLLALIPAIFLLLERSRFEREMAGEHARDTALRTARNAAVEEERLIEGMRQLLATSARVAEAAGARTACTEVFPRLLRDDPRLADLGVTGPDGRLRCSASGTTPPDLAGSTHASDAIESGNFEVGDYSLGDAGGEPTVGFAAPLQDEKGRPAGAVYATLRLAWLTPLLEDARLPEDATALILDEKGALLARNPAGPLELGLRPDAPLLVERVLDLREGTVLAKGGDGIRRIYGFTFVPRGEKASGIYVVVGLPIEPVLAPLERIALRDLGLLLVVAIFAAAVAWVGGTLVLRPLQSLARTTGRLRRGELAARVGAVTGPGEIRELAWSFDAMAESLERTTGRLRSRADELAAVATAARALVDDASLEAVAAVVVEQARTALQAPGCALWVVQGDEMVLLTAHGFEGSLRPVERLRRDSPVAAAEAWRTGRTISIPDLRADRTAGRIHTVAAATGLRSVLAVPLHFRGSIVAVLGLGSPAPDHFGTEQIHLATALGDLFAAGVQNARLFEQVRNELWIRESFIAAAAHELRSPATSLKTLSMLLQRRLAGREEDRRVVERMARISNRTATLARDLLDTHDLLGGEPLQLGDVDLRKLVDRAAHEVAQLGEARDVVVEVEGRPVVRADASRLGQALRALLDLAFRYQPDGGLVRVVIEALPEEVRIRVSDRGPGIPGDRLGHVFEPLFEPWPPGSPHYIGIVGLGPFLARLVVEAHGGKITIESRVGRGSTTTIHLPRPTRVPSP